MVGSGSREQQAKTKPAVEKQAEQESAAPQISKPTLPPGQAIVGGVQRPASDVALGKDTKPGAKEPPKKPHGYAPPISPDSNEQTKLVAEAKQGKSPSDTARL